MISGKTAASSLHVFVNNLLRLNWSNALGIDPESLFHSVVNTVSNLKKSEQVSVQAQMRGNATKAKYEDGGNVNTFIAGAALGALIVGLAGKSK
ncbi:hypothetical protein [Nitrincola tibetensis]|uniref:hypothetical protein n=1 Tax=Nitrincola tibetensis TaxID=2219697 RepID=UPI001961F7FC|nr:hypothetical protein [Nitrincola tibetensis]